MAVALISMMVKDGEGFVSRVPFYYNESQVNTIEKIQNVVDGLTPLLKGLTGCGVFGAEVTFPITPPAGHDGVNPGYRVDAGATLSFYNNSGRSHSLFVPGMLLSLLSAGKVDLDAAAVTAFAAALTAGTGITGAHVSTDGNEIPLSALRAGNQSVRKTRR